MEIYHERFIKRNYPFFIVLSDFRYCGPKQYRKNQKSPKTVSRFEKSKVLTVFSKVRIVLSKIPTVFTNWPAYGAIPQPSPSPAVRRQGISSQTQCPATKKNGRKRWIHPSEIFVSIRPTLLIFLLNPSFPFYIGENKGFLVAFRNGEILITD